jgi:hypothetical protein
MHLLLLTFFVLLGGFTIFHWYLIIVGKTTIELVQRENLLSGLTIKEKLEIIFGTKNIIKCLLPSVRVLKCRGILWA